MSGSLEEESGPQGWQAGSSEPTLSGTPALAQHLDLSPRPPQAGTRPVRCSRWQPAGRALVPESRAWFCPWRGGGGGGSFHSTPRRGRGGYLQFQLPRPFLGFQYYNPRPPPGRIGFQLWFPCLHLGAPQGSHVHPGPNSEPSTDETRGNTP